MKMKVDFWLKFSVVNLFLVALIGTFLRLKVLTEFPLQQKHFLHSHSHFAFAGWVSHTLMVLMVYYLKNKYETLPLTRYIKLIIANLVCSYGMLIFFIYQGYAAVSITFSTLSILVSYVFAYYFYKDSKHLISEAALKWFQGGLFFYVLSSLGTFFLAYSMTAPKINFDVYFSSIYFYLHFQYNGWFLFACIGLFISLFKIGTPLLKKFNQMYYLLFFATLVTYGLSILWLDISEIIYWIIAFFGLLQLLVWMQTQKLLVTNFKNEIKKQPKYLQFILMIVAGCLLLKFILQFLLVFPSLATTAFGLRPVVIAFLHLVLLGIISLFLLYFIFVRQLLPAGKNTRFALLFFVFAVFFNELILTLQGLSGYLKFSLSNVNELLLLAALLLLSSAGLLSFLVLKKKQKLVKQH